MPSGENGSTTSSHHGDPASARKRDFTSLRRRRTPVESMEKELRAISGMGRSEAEKLPDVTTPFNQPTLESAEPSTARKPEDVTEEAVVEETARSESSPPPSPEAEVPAPKALPSQPTQPTQPTAASPSLLFDSGKSASRPPINLKRSTPAAPAASEVQSLSEEKTAPEPTPVKPTVPESVETSAATRESDVVPSLPSEESAPEDAGPWPWQSAEPRAEKATETSAQTNVSAGATPPPTAAPDNDDFEWLLTDEAGAAPSIAPPLPGSGAIAPPVGELVDLERDLDEIVGRREESDNPPPAMGPFQKWSALGGDSPIKGLKETSPEAEKSSPKEVSPDAGSISAEETPDSPPPIDPWTPPVSAPPVETSATGDEEKIPVTLRSSRLRESDPGQSPSGPSSIGTVATSPLRLTAAIQGPASEEPKFPDLTLRHEPSVSAPVASDAPPSAAPWLMPTSSPPALEKEPPVGHEEPPTLGAETPSGNPGAEASSEEKVEEVPALEAGPPPISSLPRFLGGAATPPAASSPPPLATAPAEAAAPKLEEAPTSSPILDTTDYLPQHKDFTHPPTLGLQTFGEGEPPRPGERASSPSQRISLPQIADSEASTSSKAVVSPVMREEVPDFSPLDADSNTVPVTEESPPALDLPEREPIESKPMGQSSLEAAVMGRISEPPAATDKPEQGGLDLSETFLSARAKAAAASLVMGEKIRSDDEATGNETPPPVTPEVVSVPRKGSDRFQEEETSRPDAPTLDLEPEYDLPKKEVSPITDSEVEDEEDEAEDGLARVLGLIPRKKPAEPEPRENETGLGNAAEGAPVSDRKGNKPASAATLPSIDDVLEGRSPVRPLPKVGWIEGVQDRFSELEPRRKAMIFGAAAAVVIALFALVGLGAGWFGDGEGEETVAESSAVVPPEKPVVAPAEAPESPVAPPEPNENTAAAPSGDEPRKNPPVIIVDSGVLPGEAPSDAISTTPVPAVTPPSMTSLIPGEESPVANSAVGAADPDAPSTIAEGIAWSGTEESKPQTDADPQSGEPGELVLPTVGPATANPSSEGDPLLVETPASAAAAAANLGTASLGGLDTSYTELGGAGDNATAPTGAPMTTETGADLDDALARQEERVQSVAPIANQDGAAASAKKSQEPLDQAKLTLEKFLAQPSWKERLEYIYEADRLRPRIEAYYRTAPDGAIPQSVSKFFDMDENPADGGDPFYAFYLFLEGVETEFPVVVRKTSEGFKVDWELFVECKDQLFIEFRDGQSDGPATFRFVMQRHSYWGPDRSEFTNSNDYLCYKVEPPYPGGEAFVFVQKDSPLAAEVEKIATWGLPPVDVVLTLERKEFPHGVKHFVIKSLDKLSWVAP